MAFFVEKKAIFQLFETRRKRKRNAWRSVRNAFAETLEIITKAP